MPNQPDVRLAPILIVDDCHDTGGVLRELLNQLGYSNVSFVTDGKILLKADIALRYGLILLDMHMPGWDGLDIMRHLRGKSSGQCVPVIAISGDDRCRAAAIAAGAVAFLLKPFGQEELEARIHDALSMVGGHAGRRMNCQLNANVCLNKVSQPANEARYAQ